MAVFPTVSSAFIRRQIAAEKPNSSTTCSAAQERACSTTSAASRNRRFFARKTLLSNALRTRRFSDEEFGRCFYDPPVRDFSLGCAGLSVSTERPEIVIGRNPAPQFLGIVDGRPHLQHMPPHR